jgi:hypothetical protein
LIASRHPLRAQILEEYLLELLLPVDFFLVGLRLDAVLLAGILVHILSL